MTRTQLRLVAASGVCALASSVIAAVSATPSYAATSVYSVAPYTDMSNGQEGLLDTAITQHHLKAYTAAFVIGAGCNQEWGDTLPVGNDSYTDPEIARAKNEGASVIISSGGAAGEPLAWTCTNQSSIEAGYRNIINSYGVNQLDFDVEGAAVADTAAAARHMKAMKDLKASNSSLKFSMTIAVLPSGLTQDGVNILKAAKSAGIKIDVVNIMTMDYYQGSQDMGKAAISAAQNTLAQMRSVDSSYSYANLGITPMLGVNDDGSVFSVTNAKSVESFAASNGVGRLAFWSMNRDQPCSGGSGGGASSTCSGVSSAKLAFTDAFVTYEGSSGGGTGGGGGGTGNTYVGAASGKCIDDPGGSTTNKTQMEIWTCNGGANQKLQATSGHLVVEGKCLNASGATTTNNTPIIIYTCSSSAANEVFTYNTSNGTIVGKQSGKCITVQSASKTNGAKLILYTCNGGSNQKWTRK